MVKTQVMMEAFFFFYQFSIDEEVMIEDLGKTHQHHTAIGFQLIAEEVVYQEIGIGLERIRHDNVCLRGWKIVGKGQGGIKCGIPHGSYKEVEENGIKRKSAKKWLLWRGGVENVQVTLFFFSSPWPCTI
jgi:hypothetical protein